jgi:hypothetical protein
MDERGAKITHVDERVVPWRAVCYQCRAVWIRDPDDPQADRLPTWGREHQCQPRLPMWRPYSQE